MAKIMKITGSGPVLAAASGGNPHAVQREVVKRSSVGSELDPELLSLGLSDAIAESTDVDMGLVESVRQQIAEGRVSLDPAKLSEAIMDMHAR